MNIKNKSKNVEISNLEPEETFNTNQDEFQKVFDSVINDADKFTIDDEIQKEIPHPEVQTHLSIDRPHSKIVIHKFSSEDNIISPRIHLKSMDDMEDKPEIVSASNSIITKSSQDDSYKEESSSKGISALSKIKAIKKQRAERNDKNLESSSPFADHNQQNTFDSGKSPDSHKSEVKRVKEEFTYDEEEEKIMDMSRSKESYNTEVIVADYQDDDDYTCLDAFNYSDKFFDEEFIGLSRRNTNLDEIREDDEVDDEEESELKQLERTVEEIHEEINTRRKILIELAGEKVAEECYEYFRKNFDMDDDPSQIKMEEVHIFFKRKGVKDYREMVLECFRLSNVYKSLESYKRQIAELKEMDN